MKEPFAQDEYKQRLEDTRTEFQRKLVESKTEREAKVEDFKAEYRAFVNEQKARELRDKDQRIQALEAKLQEVQSENDTLTRQNGQLRQEFEEFKNTSFGLRSRLYTHIERLRSIIPPVTLAAHEALWAHHDQLRAHGGTAGSTGSTGTGVTGR